MRLITTRMDFIIIVSCHWLPQKRPGNAAHIIHTGGAGQPGKIGKCKRGGSGGHAVAAIALGFIELLVGCLEQVRRLGFAL